MTRNGLPLLVALFTVLALAVCSENPMFRGAMPTVLAQTDDPIINNYGLFYDLSTTSDDGFGGRLQGTRLGYSVTLKVNNDGSTSIAGPVGTVPQEVINSPTNDLSNIVFDNRGGLATSAVSYIKALDNGAVISTTTTAPAIRNGNDTSSTTVKQREYAMQVGRALDGHYFIEYGYYFVGEDPPTWHPLEEYDELPQSISEFNFPADEPLWADDATPGRADLDFAYEILGIEGLDTYPKTVSLDYITSLTLRTIDDTTADPVTVPAGYYLDNEEQTSLEPIMDVGGGYIGGTLTINQRTTDNKRLFNADERTLIQGGRAAIENHGTLTVNDSRLQSSGGSIISDPIYGDYYSSSFAGVGILHEYSSLSSTGGNALTLNNTQIGSPTGTESGYYEFNPDTGFFELVPYPDVVSGGIKVDAASAAPLQTTTHISAGDKIMSDGVNGRIIAGNSVSMSRNPIGEVVFDTDEFGNAVAEAKNYIDHIDLLTGPSIGIHAQTHINYNVIGDPDDEESISYLNARMLSIYENGYEDAMLITGYFDQKGGRYSTLLSTIKLNDNSWIFANTGISFGKTGMQSSSNAVDITIDRTSGIYAGGTDLGYYSGTGNLSSVNYPLYDYGYTGPIGITDRYSLTTLFAQSGDAPIYTINMPDYSGSYHEIHVSGKVIAGTPNKAGIQLRFQDVSDMLDIDLDKLKKVYYYDPTDPDRDRWGNVYYSAETAHKFVAYNDQPNKVFYVKIDGNDPIALTFFDEETQRWTVHPNASTVKIGSGIYDSRDVQSYFTPFDQSSGLGIDILGTSMAYEGTVLVTPLTPWSTYYGPTVRQIDARGNDSLVAGGKFHPSTYVSSGSLLTTVSSQGGAAMQFGPLAHVAQVNIGENKDVKNLSDVLFSSDFDQSVSNFQAFDTMTSVKRATLLYDPTLAYDDDTEKYHFDNAGVHGDIVSWYNAVVDVWVGGATAADEEAADAGGTEGGTGGGTGTGTEEGDAVTVGSGSWLNGIWTGGMSSHLTGNLNSFWVHSHPGTVYYETEILNVLSTTGPSYLLGHRDNIGLGYSSASGWSADDIPGRSLIMDEMLLYNLAGRLPLSAFVPGAEATSNDSFGYADDARHFREALAWFIYGNGYNAEYYAGLSVKELLAGYTRDGTLVTFSNGDIFSGNIYGGGVGDRLNSDIYYFQNGTSALHQNMGINNFGNIDLRFTDGTTIFNRNVIELVEGADILHYPGIRVRDVYVEKTGHLMLNDAEFSVNPFHPLTSFEAANRIGDTDYDDRLIIHDVLNEGIVSGNGVFQIAQRFNFDYGVDYFEGYFINRGILAPGLNGYIGENEYTAKELEQKAYDNMLDSVSNTAGDGYWEQLMRGVPGGQFGTITVFGSLRLMDEHSAPVYDPSSPYRGIDQKIDAGEYHVTIGNDTIKDVFNKYVLAIKDAEGKYNPDVALPEGEISPTDLKIIAMEKLGTQLSWFSPAAMIDKTGVPLLSQYEQFEYLTNPEKRAALQQKVVQMVLSPTEFQLYNTDPVQRAALNQKIFQENNIRFDATPMDNLLWRFGFSDVVSVHGTIPSYWYRRNDWENNLTTYNIIRSSFYNNPNNAGSVLLGMTQLGGVVQADRIYDTDSNADQKEDQTSYIIVASEGFTDGMVNTITSDTTKWVFANVDVLPVKLATGQTPAVLTVVDDPNYYHNRVSKGGDSYNARSIASALDDAMLTNPGLALSFQFGLNSPEVLNDTLRQVASSTRANSVVMNLWSPSDNLFNQIGYGHGGLSTGRRGDIIYRNNGQLEQPYGQPAVPPPGYQYAAPMGRQYRGQSPMYRTGSIWGAYTHSNFSMGDDGNSYKFTYYRNGATIGSEWNLTPSSVLGGVASINQGTLQSLSDEVDSSDYSFGLYFAAAPFEQFEVKSYLGGGYQSYKTDRYIRNSDIFIGGNTAGLTYQPSDVFGIDEHYDSETSGYSFNYAVEFARPFKVNPNFVIRPAAGFEYQNLRQKGYSEQLNEGSRVSWSNNGTNMAEFNEAEGATSGTYAMNYRKMDFSRSLLRFGLNTESYFARGGWQFRGYYVHKLSGDRYPISTQSFSAGSQNFNVRGGELGTSYVQVGLGTHLWLNRDRTTTLFMNGDWNFSLINKGYSLLNLNTGLQLNF